jgi:hypothetical protein
MMESATMRLTSVGKSTGTTLMDEFAVAIVLTMRLCSSTSIQEMKDTVQLKVSLCPSTLVAERHGQAMPIAASAWAVSHSATQPCLFFSNSYKRLPHVESSQINCLTSFQKQVPTNDPTLKPQLKCLLVVAVGVLHVED